MGPRSERPRDGQSEVERRLKTLSRMSGVVCGGKTPGRRRQIVPWSWNRLGAIEAYGTDHLEIDIHQTPIGANKTGAAAIDRQPWMGDFQKLAIRHFDQERHERVAMNEFNNSFFHLFGFHGQFPPLDMIPYRSEEHTSELQS